MNNGIVMEKHRRYTIVMRKDGAFQKALPVEGASVGDEVSYELFETRNRSLLLLGKNTKRPVRFITMACMLLLILMPFYFITDTDKTYAYVNIDINPSIELEIDKELRVKSIVPLNKDAKVLVGKLAEYEGDELKRVIDHIMDESEKAGLLKNGKNMLVGVSYISESKDISVLDTIDRYFLTNNPDWKIATFQVPEAVRKTAKESKKSMNELMATNLAGVKDVNKVSEAKDKNSSNPVNYKEKVIINSFYNKDSNQSTSAEEEIKVNNKTKDIMPSEKDNQKKHPSELKVKNGKINSNGKNKKSNGHKNKKEITKNNKSNGKAKGHEKAKQNKHKHGKVNKQDEKGKSNKKANPNNRKNKNNKHKYNKNKITINNNGNAKK